MVYVLLASAMFYMLIFIAVAGMGTSKYHACYTQNMLYTKTWPEYRLTHWVATRIHLWQPGIISQRPTPGA